MFALWPDRPELLPLATEIVDSHIKRSETLHTVRYLDPKTGDERALRIEIVHDRWERVSLRKDRAPRTKTAGEVPNYAPRDFLVEPPVFGPTRAPASELTRRAVGPAPLKSKMFTVLPYND